MNHSKILSLLIPSTLLIISCISKKELVSIGTGSTTGVYYPAGNAIAKIVNNNSKIHNVKVSVQSTGGSVFNINAILSKELDFGIVQSDKQYQAYYGLSEWEGKPHKNLRSIFSLHPEILTLLASQEKNISSVQDLKGKKVNIGNIGSGTRQNALDVFKAKGIYLKSIKAEGVKASDAPSLLQDGRLDAFFYTVGHPSGTINTALAGSKPLSFIPINLSSSFYKKYPYYVEAFIKQSSYPDHLKENVPSLAVTATICTRADVSEKAVYEITKAVFDNFEAFKKLHAAFSQLEIKDLLKAFSAPIHPGSLKYYKEKGLDKFIQ